MSYRIYRFDYVAFSVLIYYYYASHDTELSRHSLPSWREAHSSVSCYLSELVLCHVQTVLQQGGVNLHTV